jgi:hypothetical protein
LVTADTKSDIPVTPPSMKLFGKRKLLSPNPAEKIPATINANSLKYNNVFTWLLLSTNLKTFV